MKGNNEGCPGSVGAARPAHEMWPARTRRTVGLIAVVAAGALALSACGGGSTNGQSVATLPPTLPATTTQPGAVGGGPSSTQGGAGAGLTTSTSSIGGGAATTLPSAASTQEEALEFAKCMRSNGITNFPDPNSGGGFIFRTGAGGPRALSFKPLKRPAKSTCHRARVPARLPPNRRSRRC